MKSYCLGNQFSVTLVEKKSTKVPSGPVHLSPHRHKPKKEYCNEGDKQGGLAEKPRPTLPTLKLGSYDGSTCLATFLAKFTSGQAVTTVPPA